MVSRLGFIAGDDRLDVVQPRRLHTPLYDGECASRRAAHEALRHDERLRARLLLPLARQRDPFHHGGVGAFPGLLDRDELPGPSVAALQRARLLFLGHCLAPYFFGSAEAPRLELNAS